MCGIAGIIGENIGNSRLLKIMLESQKHRGPDYKGVWCDEGISLGHNRLSILDLNSRANQPMVSSCNRYTLVFNGEIYNYLELKKDLEYPFKSKSDSEVLIALYIKYGENMLNYLNGMFSFAIWDNQLKVLFAARDRFGVKPFHYSYDKGQFLFASEIKSLIAAGVNSNSNEVVWADYLTHGSYGNPDETFFEEIKQLPAGHCLVIGLDAKRPKIKKYYDFVSRVNNHPTYSDEEELKSVFHELLLDSISLRFRSDVALGVNVSGGLDSSILLSIIADYSKGRSHGINAFTFSSGDQRYDETPWVRDLVSIAQCPLNEVLLQPNEIPALIQKVSHHQDEPYGGFPTLAYSKTFAAAREKGVIVLLDGQGMDEAWAGYDYYRSNSNYNVQGVNTAPTRKEVLSTGFEKLSRSPSFSRPFECDILNKQYRDIFYTKIPRALRFNDRISMMYGTELREPFLDYRLMELGFSQNLKMKIRNGQGKWIPRQIFRNNLDKIALAPKRPLQTPQREWLSNELSNYVEGNLKKLENHPWFNFEKLIKEWELYKRGNNDNSFFIWQWLSVVNSAL